MEQKTKKWTRPTVALVRLLEKDLENANADCCRLETNLKELANELDRVREANVQLAKMNAQMSKELQNLRSRGFWGRLFNR